MSATEISADQPSAQKGYRFSALLAGLAKMWKGALPALLFIVVNAVVQGLLMFWNVQSGFSVSFALSVIVSTGSALILYAGLSATALQVAGDGRASIGSVLAQLPGRAAPFTVWALIQWVLILVCALIVFPLAFIAAPLTPFLPFAALDGNGNPLKVNFATIRAKFGRWAITSLVLTVLGVVLFLAAVFNTFLIKGTPASLMFWVVMGIVAWWIQTAWALIYRSAQSGSGSAE